jgi:hypothetical protein
MKAEDRSFCLPIRVTPRRYRRLMEAARILARHGPRDKRRRRPAWIAEEVLERFLDSNDDGVEQVGKARAVVKAEEVLRELNEMVAAAELDGLVRPGRGSHGGRRPRCGAMPPSGTSQAGAADGEAGSGADALSDDAPGSEGSRAST